jgi:hypothetical protein
MGRNLLSQQATMSVVCCLWLGIVCLAHGRDAVVEVDARKVVHAIPRTVFGGFMEPIRSAVYGGGLWAQIIENPSFEENLWSANAITHMVSGKPELARSSGSGLPLPWESLEARQGARFEPRWGDAANSFRSLLLLGLPRGQTGVRQALYLPVHRVLRYTGSIFAKPISGEKKIEISLRRRDRADEFFARREILLTSNDWNRYEFSLELTPGQLALREPADFVVAVANEARVLVDQVLLFPADRMDGLNPEAVAMTKALKLPLLRYGGNFTSGYHWRDGIGPMNSLLDTRVEVETYDISQGSPRSPEVRDVPYLDVVATANEAGNKLTLFAVNRHLTQDIAAAIKLSGFNVRNASGQVLAANSIYVGNDDAQPNAAVSRGLALKVAGSGFSHVFPKSSITMIEFRSDASSK